jgi:hypothetical protein
MKGLSLFVLPDRMAICQISPREPIPGFLFQLPFWSLTRSDEELSVVLPEERVPDDWRSERGWRCLKVIGCLDFGLTGILASLCSCLADVGVSSLVISTYSTDYLLVKDEDLGKARKVLAAKGYEVK